MSSYQDSKKLKLSGLCNLNEIKSDNRVGFFTVILNVLFLAIIRFIRLKC